MLRKNLKNICKHLRSVYNRGTYTHLVLNFRTFYERITDSSHLAIYLFLKAALLAGGFCSCRLADSSEAD